MVQRLVVPALLLAACSPASPTSDAGVDAGTDGRVGQCAAGLKPYGPACIPIFDECKDDEVPLLGGGCKKVGVEECEIDGGPGIKGPPDWSCKPVGPPRTCLVGWAITGDGWCEPILPKDLCGPGTMEVIGKSECQPIGDCGSGTWGKIITGAATIHVDKSYAGGGSDGSAAKPYLTIGAAVKAAAGGARLAIAAGTYAEIVTVDKPLIVEGRCAQLVKISGPAGAPFAVGIAAKGVELRGVTVSGSKIGIGVDAGAQALVEHVVVQGCETVGIASQLAQVTLREALVDRSAAMLGGGVYASGATVAIERSTVRDTAPHPPPHGRRRPGGPLG